MTAEHVYTAGDAVTLIDGPQNTTRHILSASEIERGYIPVIIPSATPRHPADRKDGVSTTPVFDRALGMPTPEPGVGAYVPSRIKHVWRWSPKPGTRYAIAKQSEIA